MGERKVHPVPRGTRETDDDNVRAIPKFFPSSCSTLLSWSVAEFRLFQRATPLSSPTRPPSLARSVPRAGGAAVSYRVGAVRCAPRGAALLFLLLPAPE